MKNNIALGILSIAIIILYILHFSSLNKSENNSTASAEDTTAITVEVADSTENEEVVSKGIAYVNMDTLLEKYKFAKDVNARLLKKEKDARAKLSAKDNQLRNDYAKVQERYQKGLLNQMNAQEESEKLMKQQQELMELEKTLTQGLLDEQKKFNKQLQDSILKFFKEYNAEMHYEAIFSNTANDNIIYADKKLNITSEVINKLNARYKK